MTSAQIRKMVYMAFTAALTVLLAKLTRFPPFPSAPYLKLEFSEIPLLLLCMFGSFPMGLVSLFLKELLSLLFWGTNAFALTADFAACAVFLGAFSFCCKKQFGTVRLLVSFLIAAVVRVLAAIPLNLLILPLQFGTPISGVWTQMGILLPFNALKALLDAACVFFLLPCLRKPLTKAFYPLYNKK